MGHNAIPVDSPSHDREQLFYKRLLTRFPDNPQDDLEQLCCAWREVTDGDWAWLWLFNPDSGSFELAACTAREGAQDNKQQLLPKKRQAPSTNSVAAYCLRAREPVFCGDFRNWSRRLDDVEYRVVTADLLEELGCVAFECIPLVAPVEGESESRRLASGVVSIHWRDAGRRVEHSATPLDNMARVSALFIRDSRMSEQRGILVKLNRMAQRYVTKPSRRPVKLRDDYLKALIQLIQAHINVRQVSIFYKTPIVDSVECIATTGLLDSRGGAIPESNLYQATYKAFEGLTGCCFGSGTPILVQNPARDKRHLGKYRETREVAPRPDSDDPCYFAPIPQHQDEQTNKARALGVIRCTEHASPLYSDQLCPFNSTELETLGFIAEQIGPVLQFFAQRIGRERSVSIVKHDLAVPLVLVRDVVSSVIGAMSSGAPIGEHDLEDIQASNYLAINLVQQLDPKPGTVGRLNKEPTYLEGGIVARLAKMMRRFARITNDVDIYFDGFRAIPMLMVDRDQIERAVFNLVLNAIKYAERKTRIEIVGRETEEGYWVDVTNHGFGISNTELPYVFEPGYRSARATQTAQGLGLGLPITREIMRAHGGDVVVTSPKDPTIITLYFPRGLEVTT